MEISEVSTPTVVAFKSVRRAVSVKSFWPFVADDVFAYLQGNGPANRRYVLPRTSQGKAGLVSMICRPLRLFNHSSLPVFVFLSNYSVRSARLSLGAH